MKADYYVYLHKTMDGKIFYVGKGRAKRAYAKTSRGAQWYEEAKNGFTVEIYKGNLTEDQALQLESLMISSMPLLTNKHISTPISFQDYSEYFSVDPHSPSGLSRIKGVFTGTYLKGMIGPCGHKAKRKDGQEYWRVKYKNKSVQVHRIIWQLTYGYIPKSLVVDHIDGDSLNNSLSNLRVLTQGDNCKNRRKSLNNTSGVHGVCVDDYSCRVMWVDSDGRRKSKRFNIRKLGFDEAMRQAAEFRKNRDAEAGYTQRHGT